MILPDALRFLSIFCAGIATGTWVVTQLALIPAIGAFGEKDAIKLLRVTETGIVRFNALCALISVIAGLLLLMLRLSPTDGSALSTAVGCAGALGAWLISVFWNMPLRWRIASEVAGTAPPDYPQIQQMWNRGNLARTLLGLVAFAGYVIAAL